MEDSENTLTRSSELVVGMLVVAFVVFVLWVVLLRPTESPKPPIGSKSTGTSTAAPREIIIKGPNEAWQEVIATPTPVITPTPTTTPRPPPPPTPTIYTVQPGDTLSAIATRYNVTVDDLVRKNRIVNPDALQVGQDLTIPTPPAPQ